MLAVSGSVVRTEHSGSHEDIDFFAVAAKGKLWQAFAGCLLQGWQYARRLGMPRTFLCFNYLVDESHPEEIDLSHPDYAREFMRLEVLIGGEVYASLLERSRAVLEAVDPLLFAEAKRRAEESRSAESQRTVQRSGGAWPVVYSALKLALFLATKHREGGWRRHYPGGRIYSNARVIRSHFRRAWNHAIPAQHGAATAEAFTNVAAGYREAVVESPANRHMRRAVHDVLAGLVFEGTEVLDLGAGTGEDAVWMAQRGASVLAVDIAPGMVAEARRRVTEAGVADRVEVRQLAIEEMGRLLPGSARRFVEILTHRQYPLT